jgi:transcriptional regulator with XRE-family HTH domain
VATEDVYFRLGQRVRNLRKARGWNQDDLAQHSGLGRTYISNVERGAKNPSLKALLIFAGGFEMTLIQFLEGVEIPPEKAASSKRR